MSPTPGRSTLITSAPNQASNCVQVGPDCTCVKSRIRTPSSALPALPNGAVVGSGKPPLPDFAIAATAAAAPASPVATAAPTRPRRTTFPALDGFARLAAALRAGFFPFAGADLPLVFFAMVVCLLFLAEL